nr:photosystem I assembly protein Ycf37 [Chroomonas collegionis]
MENILPLIYLLILLSLLGSLAFFLGQEIIKKRAIESKLYNLQKKVREDQATYQDYYLLGTLYLSKKLFDQAIVQFRYSLKLWDSTDNEGLANLYNTIGFTYFESEQYDLAIYYYKEAIKKFKTYTTAWNNLGYAYEKKKMNSEALNVYEKVLDYDSENEIALSQMQLLRRKVKIRDDRI